MPDTGPASLLRVPAVPLSLGLISGVLFSVQAFTNGRLGGDIGSSEIAATASQVVALIGTAVLVAATGALRRSLQRHHDGARVPWGYGMVGLCGSYGLIVLVVAAPKLGITVLTVALVCGQTLAALTFDRLGLSPAGRHPVTPARLLGVALAIVAVVIGAVGTDGHIDAGLVALVVSVGAAFAVSTIGLSHLSRATGEPLVAALVNFAVGSGALVIYALIVTGGDPPGGWSAPAHYWITGGLCAIVGVFTFAFATKQVGVLRLTLLVLTGQAVGALMVDLIAPAQDASVTIGTLVSLVLLLAAVVVSNRNSLRVAREAVAQPPAPAPATTLPNIPFIVLGPEDPESDSPNTRRCDD